MTPVPSTPPILRWLLPAALTLWVAALGFAVWATGQISDARLRAEASRAAFETLTPEMDRFQAYQAAVTAARATPTDAPTLRDWLQRGEDALMPESSQEEASARDASRLHRRTATLRWPRIHGDRLRQVVDSAEQAPAPYRLSAITLTPGDENGMLQADAVFHAFTR